MTLKSQMKVTHRSTTGWGTQTYQKPYNDTEEPDEATHSTSTGCGTKTYQKPYNDTEEPDEGDTQQHNWPAAQYWGHNHPGGCPFLVSYGHNCYSRGSDHRHKSCTIGVSGLFHEPEDRETELRCPVYAVSETDNARFLCRPTSGWSKKVDMWAAVFGAVLTTVVDHLGKKARYNAGLVDRHPIHVRGVDPPVGVKSSVTGTSFCKGEKRRWDWSFFGTKGLKFKVWRGSLISYRSNHVNNFFTLNSFFKKIVIFFFGFKICKNFIFFLIDLQLFFTKFSTSLAPSLLAISSSPSLKYILLI